MDNVLPVPSKIQDVEHCHNCERFGTWGRWLSLWTLEKLPLQVHPGTRIRPDGVSKAVLESLERRLVRGVTGRQVQSVL